MHKGEISGTQWTEVEARADRVINTILSAYALEETRISHAPDKYALPPPLHFNSTVRSLAPGSLLEKLMNAIGAVSVTEAFIDALTSRAISYLKHSASRRLSNSLVKRSVAKVLIFGASTLRAGLRFLNRRS